MTHELKLGRYEQNNVNHIHFWFLPILFLFTTSRRCWKTTPAGPQKRGKVFFFWFFFLPFSGIFFTLNCDCSVRERISVIIYAHRTRSGGGVPARWVTAGWTNQARGGWVLFKPVRTLSLQSNHLSPAACSLQGCCSSNTKGWARHSSSFILFIIILLSIFLFLKWHQRVKGCGCWCLCCCSSAAYLALKQVRNDSFILLLHFILQINILLETPGRSIFWFFSGWKNGSLTFTQDYYH